MQFWKLGMPRDQRRFKPETRPETSAQQLLTRSLLFAALWMVLTRADPASWVIGVPAVLAATWASVRLGFKAPRPTARGPAGSGLGLASLDLATSTLARPRARQARLASWLAIDVRRLLPFVLFFVVASARGGLDVAGRILARTLDIAPGFITYRIRLRHPGARILFIDLISLLPGTLSADIEGSDRLVIHVLDVGSDNFRELAQLELQVALLFREPGGAGAY
ncbi:putative monovalent cation/H+ antiporter subunit E [Thiorhodovibrio litoralis]|nr:putative monovalent cation/H+ antiporter subunit E [Thiorhodovibrio litoralis]